MADLKGNEISDRNAEETADVFNSDTDSLANSNLSTEEELKRREEALKKRIEKLERLEREAKEKEKELKTKEKAKKQVLLRLAPTLWEELAAWADEDYRSINGQIEYLLAECVRQRKKR